jgi:hypothetical protein
MLTNYTAPGYLANRNMQSSEDGIGSGTPTSFSPADMRVVVHSPVTRTPFELGTLAMLSYSSHRDKFPVVSLGRRGIRGFTSGHRTVAGSLAFQTFNYNAFIELNKEYFSKIVKSGDLEYILPDELPPFDIHVLFVNEDGQGSFFKVFGVTLLDFGSTFSVDQILMMESYSFMARGLSSASPVFMKRKGTFQDISQSRPGIGNDFYLLEDTLKDPWTSEDPTITAEQTDTDIKKKAAN